MNVKSTDLNELQSFYEQTGNQLIILYGNKNCGKEELLKTFAAGKKSFYYRCREVSAQDQMSMMGEEIKRHFDVKLTKNTYDE